MLVRLSKEQTINAMRTASRTGLNPYNSADAMGNAYRRVWAQKARALSVRDEYQLQRGISR